MANNEVIFSENICNMAAFIALLNQESPLYYLVGKPFLHLSWVKFNVKEGINELPLHVTQNEGQRHYDYLI
jgi:hypothetical protein